MREGGSRRRCIATGETHDRSSLLRFVVGPGGELCPDVSSRLPGRGLWLCPRRDIVETAVKRRLFARAARQAVTTPPGLADRVEGLLAQRCCEVMGLARRAGVAVAGFEKVRSAVSSRKATVLLMALDGAEGGRQKMRGIGRCLPIVIALTAAEMGAVFGREHVVNAAIGDDPLGSRLIAIAEKLAGFRSGAIVDRGTEAGCDWSARLDSGIGAR
jgi:uncharacterized protein